MGFDNVMAHLDESIANFFGQWNVYTTALVTLLIGTLTYQIVTSRDPDIHPVLLSRQAQASPVRNEGESPVFRSQGAPHGMPLNSGLNVRKSGASRWARGRDGDLRDVWRQTVQGVQDEGAEKGAVGRLLTVMGTENVKEHDLGDVTRQINLVGKHLQENGGTRVAVYLPNSVEWMASLFACAFRNMTAVLLPFDQSPDALISMLRRSGTDAVVTISGAFPFDQIVQSCPALRQLIWVVDDGSRHLDWSEVPKGAGGRVNVTTWHDILADSPADSAKDLPPLLDQHEAPDDAPDVIVFWPAHAGAEEIMVRFTPANLVAGVAAQVFAVPTSQRLGPSDLFLPADSLSHTYTLVLTLAALYCNTSVAFNSAAARANDLLFATRGVAPTVLVATPAALLKTHEDITKGVLASFLARQLHRLQVRTLTQSGVMPAANSILSRLLAPSSSLSPGKLRLIFTADRAGADTSLSPSLSSTVLSDLRVFTGARVLYALSAAKVAGAVAQTAFYDYGVWSGDATKRSHFGPPMTSTEVLLKDQGNHRSEGVDYRGEIVVRGPAVSGGEAALGVIGTIREDNTLAYL